MPIHSHWSKQPAPQALYETNRVCLYTICIEIHKQVLDYIYHDNRYDVLKDIVYYVSLMELEMSVNVLLGSTNCYIR